MYNTENLKTSFSYNIIILYGSQCTKCMFLVNNSKLGVLNRSKYIYYFKLCQIHNS